MGNERRVSAIADSAGMANVLYGVHDRFEALFDSKTFCSNSVFKHIEEGSHRREANLSYDYPKHKSVLRETNLKTNETKYAENDIQPCVTDVVTGFYDRSSLRCKMGNSYTFPVNDGGKTAEVTAHVEGKEKVKVPAGTCDQRILRRRRSHVGQPQGQRKDLDAVDLLRQPHAGSNARQARPGESCYSGCKELSGTRTRAPGRAENDLPSTQQFLDLFK